jgi:hypothetical protein
MMTIHDGVALLAGRVRFPTRVAKVRNYHFLSIACDMAPSRAATSL